MYLPNGVWLHIKSFLFKTPEMKLYDKLVSDFDYLCKIKNELTFLLLFTIKIKYSNYGVKKVPQRHL